MYLNTILMVAIGLLANSLSLIFTGKLVSYPTSYDIVIVFIVIICIIFDFTMLSIKLYKKS